MKLETCNIWGGRVYEPLIDHLKKQKESIDIFCFQEVYHSPGEKMYTRDVSAENNENQFSNVHPARGDIYSRLAEALPDFRGYYRSAQQGFDYYGKVDFELYFGLATFVKDGVEVIKEGDIFVYRSKDSAVEGDNATLGRNMQYVHVMTEGKPVLISNMHGLWNGKGKTDSPDRLEQSRKVKTFLDREQGAKILCGDFNLLPGTESLLILEDNMRNLITEYGVTSTRSEYYAKPEKFADYILVSPEVEVKNFEVVPEPISDHLALVLEFE